MEAGVPLMRQARSAAAIGCLVTVGFAALYLWSGWSRPERPLMPNATVTVLIAWADADNGARLFRQCAACHNISKGAPDRNGPNLYGVLGSPVASSSSRFGYTHALRSAAGRWDVERMNAWLEDPQRFIPGNRMFFPGMPDPWERADLIAYLGTRGSKSLLPGAARGAQRP